MELVQQADWILTKNDIIKKVKRLFEQLMTRQIDWLRTKQGILPAEVYSSSPKISKGENYKGLPYLILDHPRVFDKDDILAIRTMFWWGNFFSVTLHLSGKYKTKYEENILSAFPFNKDHSFFVCIQPDQWEHHFEATNYLEMEKLRAEDFESVIRANTFIKLAGKISLENWEGLEEKLFDYFRAMTDLLV